MNLRAYAKEYKKQIGPNGGLVILFIFMVNVGAGITNYSGPVSFIAYTVFIGIVSIAIGGFYAYLAKKGKETVT